MRAADERRGTAIYEAGRAVVAWGIGLKVRRIAIAEVGNLAISETDIEEKQSMSLVDKIALCAAGAMAEHTFKAPANGNSASSDMNRIRDLLDGREPLVVSVLRDIGFQKAHDLLYRHQKLVTGLADALAARDVLTEPEILALLEHG